MNYHNKKSPFHEFDPRTKLFFFISISALSLVSTNILYLFAVFAFTLIIFSANHLPFSELKNFSKFFIILSIFVVFFQGFFYPLGKTPVYQILNFNLTVEGLVFGLGISFRLFAILFSVAIFMLTTKPKELIESLGNLMPKELAFSLTTTFRFIPIFQNELKTIMISQESRGLRSKGAKKLTVYFPVIVPLFAKALTRARYMAFSIESRGFGDRNVKYQKFFTQKDWAFVVFILIFGFVLIRFFLF